MPAGPPPSRPDALTTPAPATAPPEAPPESPQGDAPPGAAASLEAADPPGDAAALRGRVAELEAALAASEERFRSVAGGKLDAFYVFEAERDDAGRIVDFRFVELNPMGECIIGQPREEVIGQRLCELLPVNRERGYFDRYAEVVETGEPVLMEESFGEADGIHASWLQFQAVKVGDGVAIHTRDITARKVQEQRTQELLREQQRLLREQRMIFDAVPSMIFFKDTQNNVLRVNQAVADRMGLPVSEIEGRASEDMFPEEAAAYYRDDLAVLRSGEPKLGYTEPQTLPSGELRWLRTDKSPLYGGGGEPLGVLAVVTDVTEQRRAVLQAAVLEKAVEERQAIGRNLHDGIGQQMTGVRMLIEKVRRQVRRGEEPSMAALDEIAGVVAAASTEVRRMISGLTPERITPEELPVALGQVASNVQTFYGVAAESDCDREVTGLCEEAANHFLAIAQEAAINAAKHAGASRIRIRLTVDDAGVVLSVTDDGRGLPGGVAASGVEGTGRGMQILHYRADAMGARLEVGPASEPCGGGGSDPHPGDPHPGGDAAGGTRICCTLAR